MGGLKAMKTIGSQKRELLAESGYVLIEKKGREVLLRELESNKVEVWWKNDHHAGYTIEIDGVGYEFIKTVGFFVCQQGKFAFIEPV
jgi:hypothetical protein